MVQSCARIKARWWKYWTQQNTKWWLLLILQLLIYFLLKSCARIKVWWWILIVWCRIRSTASPAGRRKYSAFSLAMPLFLFSTVYPSISIFLFTLFLLHCIKNLFTPFFTLWTPSWTYELLWLSVREYWMIYRGPGFLAVVWFGFSPIPFPLPATYRKNEKERQLADGMGGGEGMGE